jgi:hypothetical protein
VIRRQQVFVMRTPTRRVRRRSIPQGVGNQVSSRILHQYVLTGYDPLGFSLKPPRWIRKAQPGVFIRKNIIPIAAGASLFLIPGAAPLALKAVTGAGSLLARGGKAAGGGVSNLVRSLFAKRPTQPTPPILQPGVTFTPPGGVPVDVGTPFIPPTPTVASEQSFPSSPGATGGGGEAPPEGASAPPPAQAGGAGLAIAGGVLLLAMLAGSRRGRVSARHA